MINTAPESDRATAALERKLARARRKIAVLEGIFEDQTRSLYLAQEELRKKSAFLESILANMPSAVVVTDSKQQITAIGGSTSTLVGLEEADIVGRPLADLVEVPQLDELEPSTRSDGQLRVGDGSMIPVSMATARISDEYEIDGSVVLLTDLTEQQELEVQLRHAQKLESVGQLAAGVAHEINTPIQFIGDSVSFLGEAMTDMLNVLAEYGALRELAINEPSLKARAEVLLDLEEEADLEFVIEEAPRSIQRTLDGVQRVAKIVSAMKQFSHPGGGVLAPESLNEIVDTTLTVAKNEYKYIAEVTTTLGDVPDVPCDRGDVGQVLLNLVVNAAHAIEGHVEPGTLGSIHISTKAVRGGVELSVTDNGGGVPDTIRERIFDPFFTTKAPGKGTGQGLSIAHSLMTDKHNGSLEFDVEEGVGSTFRLWIPADS